MKIIGHRGAAGSQLENTIASIEKAKEFGVDGIEIDVRLTSDHQLMLSHDHNLKRVSGTDINIADSTLAQLQKVALYNNERVATLDEALDCSQGIWTIIEVKDSNCLEELLACLDRHPEAKVSVASFDHNFAAKLEMARPKVSVFLAERFRPLEIIRLVRTAKADGLDLNAWLLNPLTYWLARRQKFTIMVYTINSRFVGKFIGLLYPKVAICTDHPERFISKRRQRKLKAV